jgi:hypothetical protein
MLRIGNGSSADAWTCTGQGITNQIGRVNAPTGLFTPNTTGVSTGLTVANGDLTAYRTGGTSGVLYLSNTGTHYLYWDGTNYQLNNGNLTVTGDITAFSDKRIKKDIKPIGDALAKIEKLNGITYKRVDSDAAGTGLIAQEVQEVLPEAVRENADTMLSVAYGNLAGLFVEAIKELNREITALKAEVKSLKDAK